jgi:hypothetical protein
LVTGRRRRQYPGHPGRPMTPMDEANAIGTADFKGQFRTRDGDYCYPDPAGDHARADRAGAPGLGLRTPAARASREAGDVQSEGE